MNYNTIADLSAAMCKILYDKKAQDILSINVADKSILADYFIICSGRNSQQVKALCNELEEKLEPQEIFARRKEGADEGRWIVLDYGDILVHIFHPEERTYYNLERLWADGENVCDFSAEMDEKERAARAAQEK